MDAPPLGSHAGTQRSSLAAAPRARGILRQRSTQCCIAVPGMHELAAGASGGGALASVWAQARGSCIVVARELQLQLSVTVRRLLSYSLLDLAELFDPARADLLVGA